MKFSKKNCPSCDKIFIPHREDQKCCNHECNDKYQNKKRKLNHQKLMKSFERKCLCCGRVFTPKRKDQQCCNQKCSLNHQSKERVHNHEKLMKSLKRKCLWCNKELMPKKKDQQCCCKKCNGKYQNEQSKLRHKKLMKSLKRKCPVCDKKFIPYKTNQKCCSYKCTKNIPTNRIAQTLRRNLWGVLKSQNANKSTQTLELLGCTIKEFKQYLDSKFRLGMSWNNYGKWHIDHIRPCASFDLKDPEQQRKCFHYINLQPLWAEENLKKWKKY